MTLIKNDSNKYVIADSRGLIAAATDESKIIFAQKIGAINLTDMKDEEIAKRMIVVNEMYETYNKDIMGKRKLITFTSVSKEFNLGSYYGDPCYYFNLTINNNTTINIPKLIVDVTCMCFVGSDGFCPMTKHYKAIFKDIKAKGSSTKPIGKEWTFFGNHGGHDGFSSVDYEKSSITIPDKAMLAIINSDSLTEKEFSEYVSLNLK